MFLSLLGVVLTLMSLLGLVLVCCKMVQQNEEDLAARLQGRVDQIMEARQSVE